MRPIAGLLLFVTVVALMRTLAAAPLVARAAGQTETDLAAPAPLFEWRGSASCAAAACHNANTPGGVRGREYAIWVTRDPHRTAFGVLYDDRSTTIERNLQRTSPINAWQDARCLNCHVHPGVDTAFHTTADNASVADVERSLFVHDGVGCESCHGASGRWRDEHFRSDWKQKSDAEKQQLGMQPTKNLRARAELCAGCHVGAPGREVDHDLLAAGHPRLSFEFAAFLANMPKHWDETAERQAEPDLEARAWAIGQAVSAGAALRLLEQHATGHGAWPEFAGYDCFACHHDLQGRAWQSRRDVADPTRRAGAPRWGDWYFSMAGMSAVAHDNPQLRSNLADLRQALSQWNAAPEKVLPAQRAAADELRRWLDRSDRVAYDQASVRGRLSALIQTARPDHDLSWDQAAQLYLGIAALHEAEGDLGFHRMDTASKTALGEMVRQLEFVTSAPTGVRYDGPTERQQQDRQSRFLQALRDFERQLGP